MTPHIDPYEAGETPTGDILADLGFGVQEPEVFLDDERFDDAQWPEDFEAALDALSRAALTPAPPSRKEPR